MAQAYDFALEKIGMDIHAYPIWNDYLTFLKSVDAVGSYAENQKIGAVRKVIIHQICPSYCIFACIIFLNSGISTWCDKSHNRH